MKNIIIFLCTLFATMLSYVGAEINNKHIENNKIYNEEYIQSLCDAAYYYSYIGEFSKAIELEEKALELKKIVFGDNHLQCAQSLSSLAVLYHVINNNVKAIELEEMALAIKKVQLDERHIDYAQSLNSLAIFYSAIGFYSKAIKLGEKALDIIGENHINYHDWLSSISKDYAHSGQYIKAIEIGQIVLDIRKKMFGDQSPYYASSLSNIASCYFHLGDYKRALYLFEEAYKIYKTNKVLSPEFEVKYANTLNGLAVCHSHFGEHTKAIEYNEEASLIFKSILGEKHPSYIKTQRDKAFQYYYLDDNSKFISLIERTIELGRDTYGESHPDYALSLNTLTIGYFSLGEYYKALETEITASKIWEKSMGKNHLSYTTFLKNLAYIYIKFKDVENINKLIPMWLSIEKNILSNTFSNLASAQRQLYWNKLEFSYLNTLPQYAYTFSSDTLTECAYDGTLMSKGILLNTEIELAALIAKSGDKEADELYQQLLLNRGQLNRLYEMPISERWVDTDSMELATEELERELIERSKVYGDFMRNLTIDWKQVQNKLDNNDIAIEFVSFPIENNSVMYCALTLKKGYKSPRIIRLFEAHQLESIDIKDYYSTSTLSNLVWGELEEELAGMKDIYFAPASELYRIAIEYLPYGDEGKYVFDYWNLYRLSSTRELAKTKSEKNSPNVVLYGGLRYEAEGIKFEKDVTWGTNYLAMTRALPDSIGLRAQYGYLQGTLNEVTEINAIYEKNSIPTILYTGSIGTESSIKALSGKRLSNLHISTHGFYYSEKEVDSKYDLRHLSFLQYDNTPRYIEDKSMTRSGLLFAGANAILNGDTIPEGCDDGILTAQEIASLDFRGLDLLVLSACQTGLGEIKGDGVFGLQRGFKKAGAQTIVMSLWKVDDFATNLLMTQFYNNLLAGQSKHEAFHKAQDVVRSNYPDDPHKWAGFIMLDGLD